MTLVGTDIAETALAALPLNAHLSTGKEIPVKNKLRLILIPVLGLSLSACQSIDTSGKLGRLSERIQSTAGGLFAPRIDKLERLLSEGKYDEAERMLEKHGASFDKSDAPVRDRADSVRATLLWGKFKDLADQGNDEPARALVAQNAQVAGRFNAEQKDAVTAVDRRIAKAKLKSLLSSGQYREALEFARAQAALWPATDSEIAELRNSAATQYSQSVESNARKALAQLYAFEDVTLTDPSQWPAIANALTKAGDLESETKRLDGAGIQAPSVTARVKARATELRERLVQIAPAAFERHALTASDKAFETIYPVEAPRDLANTTYAKLEPRLRQAEIPAIQRFAERYGRQLGSTQKQSLAKTYTDRLMAANGKSGPVAELLLSEKLKAAALPAPTWTERAAFVRLEPDESHDGKVSVTPPPSGWMVVQARQGDAADRIASHPELSGRDVAILVRIAPPRITTETVSRQTVQSRIQAGYQQIPNARRAQIAQQLTSARQSAAQSEAHLQQLQSMDYGKSRAAANLGLLSMVVSSVGASSSQADVASLSAQLASEPATLSEPVYRNYRFAVDTRRIRKQLNVEWQLVEIKTGRRLAGRELVEAQKDFTVAVGVDQNDENARDIFAKHKDERDVQLYTQEQIKVSYSDIWTAVARELDGRW